MTRNHVLTALRWVAKAGIPINELELFQAAYFDTYKKAEPRMMWCFNDYIRKGTVPDFVRSFIRMYFVHAKSDIYLDVFREGVPK